MFFYTKIELEWQNLFESKNDIETKILIQHEHWGRSQEVGCCQVLNPDLSTSSLNYFNNQD